MDVQSFTTIFTTTVYGGLIFIAVMGFLDIGLRIAVTIKNIRRRKYLEELY